MVACTPITQEKIRAEIWMGSTLLAQTPFIQSFNVGESRNQVSNTFNASFEMIAGTVFPLGENLIIKAGTKGNLKRIFYGIIESTQAQPSFGKPSYFSVTLQGRGVLSQLENKKFSRRLRSDGQGLYCLINSGSTNRPQAYTSLDKQVSSSNKVARSSTPNPAAVYGETSPFIKAPELTGRLSGSGGSAAELAGHSAGTDAGESGGEGGLGRHDHSDLDEGGPAFAVYSAD